MVDAVGETDAARELQALNRELAAVLHTSPGGLVFGAEAALGDELVVCGILGGKDVGKSTLINALARQPVSTDSEEVGRGTERPMAYVHEAMREAVTQRLQIISHTTGIDVTPHRADAIRNVVLVDLPDFDSEFREHEAVVEAVAPLLDRVLWVQTPRKTGDRAWVELFHRVIKDARNVHCVLNKVDELLADGAYVEESDSATAKNGRRSKAFWSFHDRWLAEAVEQAGYPTNEEHRFLVAAAYPEPARFVQRVALYWDDPDWRTYHADRRTVGEIAELAAADLDRLRSRVLSPVSGEHARNIKEANQLREREVNVARIRQHYDLDRTIALVGQACDADYHQQVLNEAVGRGYGAAVAAELQHRLRGDAQLADELLERRVEQWPLLQLVYWPLGWLSRGLGRRVSPAPPRAPELRRDAFEVDGRSLAERVDWLRDRILADHAVVVSRLHVEADVPPAATLVKRVRAAAARLVPTVESRILEDARARYRRPSWLGRVLLWLLLLWFPLLQPVLEGALQMYAETGAWNFAHALYKVAAALSAAHLLAGLAVVAGIYAAILAIMYARGLRAMRAARGRKDGPICDLLLAEEIDEVLVREVTAPVAAPFLDRRDRLISIRTRLESWAEPRSFATTEQEQNDDWCGP